jgi:uncharacterized protein YyaL (SSP411 family)
MNRLAEETSPYFLQHADSPVASASSRDATREGRAGFAGATVYV